MDVGTCCRLRYLLARPTSDGRQDVRRKLACCITEPTMIVMCSDIAIAGQPVDDSAPAMACGVRMSVDLMPTT